MVNNQFGVSIDLHYPVRMASMFHLGRFSVLTSTDRRLTGLTDRSLLSGLIPELNAQASGTSDPE